MSLVRKVAHNTIIQIGGKAIGAILALITVSLMLRYLGKEGFGQYTTVIAFLSMFSILADLGLYLVVTREISKPNAPEEKIVSNAFTLKLFAAIIILTLASFIGLFFPYDPIVKIGIIIGAFSFLFILLNQVLIGIFQKYLHMEKVAIGEITGRMVWLLGVIAVIKFNLGLWSFLAAIAFSNFLNFLIVFLFARKYVKISLQFDFEIWKRIMKIAAPLAISVVFNLIYFKVDTVLLSVMKPAQDVGIYGAPYKVLESLITFAAIFAGLLLPILAKYAFHQPDKFAKIYKKGFDVLAIFIIPLIVGTLFYARPIMILFGGGEFKESAQVLRILIFACGAIFFAHLFGNSIVACNQQKKMMWIYFVTAMLSVVLNLILIPPFSYFGAATSTLASELLVVFLTAFVVYKSTGARPEFKVFGKSLLAAAVMAGVIYLLPKWYFLINVALAGITYFVILYLIKGFSKKMVLEIISFRRTPPNNNCV